MECPRCSGPLEAYALRGREAAICQECGWVGINTSLTGDGEAESPETWDDALDRVTERRVSRDRDYRPMPPVITTEEPSGEEVDPKSIKFADVDGDSEEKDEDETTTD